MDLETLFTQYNDKISVLEKELADIKHKRDVLQEALEMLNEGAISSGKTFPINNITVKSNKYYNMTWPQALLLALTDKEEMTGDQLLKELLENGFQSNSKSIKSDIYGRLGTLGKRGKIVVTKEGKQLTRYKIKQDESENKGSVPHMAGTEPDVVNGGLGERLKPADLYPVVGGDAPTEGSNPSPSA